MTPVANHPAAGNGATALLLNFGSQRARAVPERGRSAVKSIAFTEETLP